MKNRNLLRTGQTSHEARSATNYSFGTRYSISRGVCRRRGAGSPHARSVDVVMCDRIPLDGLCGTAIHAIGRYFMTLATTALLENKKSEPNSRDHSCVSSD